MTNETVDLDALERTIAKSTVTYPDVESLIAELRAARAVVEAARVMKTPEMGHDQQEYGYVYRAAEIDAMLEPLDAALAAYEEATKRETLK